MTVQQQLGFTSPKALHPLEVFGLRGCYQTPWGGAVLGDSLEVLGSLPDGSVDLVVTSPPYALHFKKEYGNATRPITSTG